ncbi:hypothetical protein DO97_12660 [Neosynechococcus sphagnicola sy1]|uniref:Chloride channel protein n=1 Tax=Neosynechococcus sphagnicola sy1 TaxID=1497020 RepID=A0A098TMX2_9CYAN|nr:chloride channel protein [Neosynechococcus sphagnicola]KGF73680.1 hypothetical protein DO97_12660 [Neosynechococcus sphagnicola sy1]
MRDISRESITYRRLLLYATIIGFGVGWVATAYYLAMELGFWLVGLVLSGAPEPNAPQVFTYGWLVTMVGGLLVALTVRWLGAPSSMNEVIDEIHRQGRVDYRQIPAMLTTSLISISCGSSVGPESPIVDISGGLGSWLGEKLKLPNEQLRILTFCGVGAGLGAFFGSPVGSALLALEFPHRKGLEYYEALVPTLVASTCGFMVFRTATGLTIGGEYLFPAYPQLHAVDFLYALCLGILGAGVAGFTVVVFRGTGYLTQGLAGSPILLNMLGGLVIGLIATVAPLTLFFGEPQIQTMINQGAKLGVGMLLLSALGKILAFSVSLNTGFRGGYVFSLFFIGAAVGEAVSLLVPAIPATVAVSCMMAAIAIALLRTPISIILIVAILSSTTLTPIITIAALTSFILTPRAACISTQQARN